MYNALGLKKNHSAQEDSMNKMQLFVTIIICSIQIQASEAGVIDVDEVEIAVAQFQQEINHPPAPVAMDNDYGSTSSIGSIGENGNGNLAGGRLASDELAFDNSSEDNNVMWALCKSIKACCFPCCKC